MNDIDLMFGEWRKLVRDPGSDRMRKGQKLINGLHIPYPELRDSPIREDADIDRWKARIESMIYNMSDSDFDKIMNMTEKEMSDAFEEINMKSESEKKE